MLCNLQSHKRSHESPMDFEWQTHAPTDPKSPFPQSKTYHKGFGTALPVFSFVNQSPTSESKFRNPSFTTPRKAFDFDVRSETSGVESSPGDHDEGDTPDQTKYSQIAPALTNGTTYRQPIFGKYGTDFLGTSPSRADHRRTKYSKTITQKLRKRKRINRDFISSRGSDTDSEDMAKFRSRKYKNSKTQSQLNQPGLLASFFDYIETHPNLPSILSFYAQLTVNFFIAGLMILGIYTFWITVRADVDKASERERSHSLAQIAKCAQDFVINGCGSENRAPIMEIPCNELDLCMNRDPNSVGRARISAHTFAQIFNSFIEPISYKAMIFIVLIVMVTLLVNNLAFGFYRSKSQQFHSFPNSNPQSYQPWVQQLSLQNTGHEIHPNLPYQNFGTDLISARRNASQNSRNRSRGRSRLKDNQDRERSSSRD